MVHIELMYVHCTRHIFIFHSHTHSQYSIYKFIYCFELVLAANAGIFNVDGDAHVHVQCAMYGRESKRNRWNAKHKGFNFQMVSEDKWNIFIQNEKFYSCSIDAIVRFITIPLTKMEREKRRNENNNDNNVQWMNTIRQFINKNYSNIFERSVFIVAHSLDVSCLWDFV